MPPGVISAFYPWLRGRSQFMLTGFSTFLTTHLPLVYNRLHLTNHLPIVNVYIWNLTTPNNTYVSTYLSLLKEGKIFIRCALRKHYKSLKTVCQANVIDDWYGIFLFDFLYDSMKLWSISSYMTHPARFWKPFNPIYIGSKVTCLSKGWKLEKWNSWN